VKSITSRLAGKRDAHPKAHGCVSDVELKVEDLKNVDSSLQTGLFSTPGKTYKAILRVSSGSDNPTANDKEPGPQGFAMKVLLDKADQDRVADIKGEEYFMDKKFYKTFDIISIDTNHEFFVNTVSDYPELFATLGQVQKNVAAAIAAKKTPAEIQKITLETLDEGYFHLNPKFASEKDKKKRPLEAALMGKLKTNVVLDPVSNTYQSWVPYLYGKNAVKYQFRPCDEKADPKSKESLEELEKEQPGVSNSANFLREVLKHRLRSEEVCFRLGVQVHQKGFPSVEEAAKPWPAPTDGSERYVHIATLRIPQKDEGKELIADEMCEALSMNPLHAPPEHIGIGNIQRSRGRIYAATESTRNKQVEEAKKKP
jgi:hypothetical protein